jgi:hypothetical protein
MLEPPFPIEKWTQEGMQKFYLNNKIADNQQGSPISFNIELPQRLHTEYLTTFIEIKI